MTTSTKESQRKIPNILSLPTSDGSTGSRGRRTNAQCPMPNAQCPIPYLNVRLSVAKDSRQQIMI
ncbi:hypothetical protein [Nostoc sp.]|uniref:hypothetical protein n=1 Tax=Nostoc sp. TaxID=1180 RepID=UPI002FF6DF7B